MSIHSFQAKHDHHRSSTTWQALLDSANNEAEVVAVARDFMASITPHEVELMPAECRPRKLVDAEDLAQYSYDLAVHRWDAEDSGTRLVQVFAAFFANASARIALVARRGNDAQRESA